MKRKLKNKANCVSMTSSGDYLAVSSLDRKINFLDGSGNLLWSTETGNLVNSLFITNEGKLLVGSKDNKIYIYDLSSYIRSESQKQSKDTTSVPDVKPPTKTDDTSKPSTVTETGRSFPLIYIAPILIVLIAVAAVVFMKKSKSTAPLPMTQTKEKSKKDELKCPSCDSPMEKGAKFCGNCGNTFDEKIELKCPNCGAAIEKGGNFCSECGQKI